MSDFDPTSGIAPYLNPNYWDPDVLRAPAKQLPRTFNIAPAAHGATLSILHFLATGGEGLETVNLNDGDTYHPGDYPPGSVVQMEVENLHSHGPAEPIDANAFKEIKIPSRPTFFAERSEMDEAGRHYQTTTFIGATASGWVLSKSGLYAMLRSDIVHIGMGPNAGLFGLTDAARRYAPEITVGQTQKYSTAGSRHEGHGDLVMRHAAVRVHAPLRRQRSTEPKTTPAKRWSPRLAFGTGGV